MATILTVFNDDSPAPRIRVNVTSVLEGTVTGTLHRIADGVDSVVPGADGLSAFAGVVVIDPFPPFGVDVTYRLECFDEAGTRIGLTDPETTRITSVPVGVAYIQSPNDPSTSVRVELLDTAGEAIEETNHGQVHKIGDRRVLIASAGGDLDNLCMDFWTEDDSHYAAALAVLRHSQGAVVIRTPPPMLVPRVLYLWVPRPRRVESNRPAGLVDVDWLIVGQQFSPPLSQVLVAELTYRRFTDFYPTYRAFRAAWATYRAHLLNPPPEDSE